MKDKYSTYPPIITLQQFKERLEMNRFYYDCSGQPEIKQFLVEIAKKYIGFSESGGLSEPNICYIEGDTKSFVLGFTDDVCSKYIRLTLEQMVAKIKELSKPTENTMSFAINNCRVAVTVTKDGAKIDCTEFKKSQIEEILAEINKLA